MSEDIQFVWGPPPAADPNTSGRDPLREYGLQLIVEAYFYRFPTAYELPANVKNLAEAN